MTKLSLTARVLPKFPARVAAGVGMLITKVNGIWTFSVNGGNVPPGNASDPANTDVFVEMPDGSIAKVPISVIQAAQQPAFPSGRVNYLINGCFQVWQRGANFSGASAISTTRTLTADRWGVKTGAGTLTSVTRPNNGVTSVYPRWAWSLQVVGNAGVTTVDVDQRCENQNVANPGIVFPLRGPITFQAAIFNNTGAPVTPTLFIEVPTVSDNWAASTIINGGGAGEGLQSCPTGGLTLVTWHGDLSALNNLNTGVGFRLQFPNGSLDSNAKSIRLCWVQVEPRPTDDGLYSPLEVPLFEQELLMCMRYFYKSFLYATVPVTNAGFGGVLTWVQAVGAAAAASGFYNRWTVPMRAAPTITFFNPSAANAQMRNVSLANDYTVTASVQFDEKGVAISATSSAGSAAGQLAALHMTADAEL